MSQVTAKFDKVTGKWSAVINGKTVSSPNARYISYRAKDQGCTVNFEGKIAPVGVVNSPAVASKADEFSINQRFSFVEKLVRMVASGVQPSAVITGQGGLGKTFTVTKTLEACGYTDVSCLADFEIGTIMNRSKTFRMVKGYSTPKGLYRTLYENNGSVIIFDDCDSVLKDPVALNLLKGALDSYDKRIISWNAESRDDDLPRSFQFDGKVIFISNLNKSNIDQAIRSRSMMIDLSMTLDQKIERMAHIAKEKDFLPEYEIDHKMAAIELISKLKDDAKEISLRTLISVTKIRATNDDWEDLATYTLCA